MRVKKMSAQEISQEFKVTLEKTVEGIEYPVRVSSSAGSATGAFVLPFSADHIEQALKNFREGIPFGRYRRRTRGELQFDKLSPEGFGGALFQALFKDVVLALYRDSLSMAEKPGGAKRMPVKLNIMAHELARLPWELLYDPKRDGFLSFGKETPVIRFVDGEPKSRTFDPPLRVLLVSANPAGTARLDLEHERKVIAEALNTLKREDKVRIDHLFGATIRELRSKIREYEPHLVHFMGHGQVNHLLLEDRAGEGLSLAESSLGIILRNASSLRMVVLNACETARPDDSELRLGLAHGLARRGVRAIVAMQFEISDEAACEFAGELYRVLAEGLEVDGAVLWGRIAVQNRFVDDIEWATPVLYLQGPEGRIFDDLLKGPETKARVDDLSAIRKEQVEVLQKRLRIHERNLWRLQEQKAKFGIMVPSHIENSIDEEQAAINQIVEELKQLDRDKKRPEPQERPAVGITDAYQEDAAADVRRRLADIVVTEKEPSAPRLLEQAQTFYEQGLRHFDKGEWAQALTFLEDVQRLDPGYKDAQRLVRTAREELARQEIERRTQEKLAALYRQALTYCDEERWQAAVDLFNEILDVDPDYKEVRAKAEEARQAHAQQLAEERTRLQLEGLYQRAQEHLAAEDWGRAIGLLEHIVQVSREYANASAQLDEARRQKQLAEFYARGEEALAVQNWEQAVANFGAAFALNKSYRDVETRLDLARQQQRWDALYQEGLEYLEAERWDEAVEALKEVQPDQKRRKDAKIAQLYAEGRQDAAQEKLEPALAKLEEVIEENPQYRDAAEQLQEVRRQKWLYDLYTEGLKRMETQEWRQAIRAFEQVAQEALDYRDVQGRLAQAREEAKLAEHYASGKRFFDLGRWSEAIQDFQSIVKTRPGYLDAQRMLGEARQERELADLYAEGMLRLDKGLWQEAIDAFEKVVDSAPDYRDAARQLDLARRKNSLINTYMDGKACYEQKDWAGAIHHLEQVMHYEEKGYRDAAILLAEAKRQERLAQLYQKGMDCLATGNWDKALSYFEQVVELDQNYRETATQLAEAQLQKRLVDTYADAEKLMEVERWEDAAAKFQQILAEVSDYRNAHALLMEVQRQHRLVTLYEAANRAYEEGRWTEAAKHFQQIEAEEAKYRDVKEKLAEAQRQQQLEENYKRGTACFERGDWQGAILALEATVKGDTNYKDAFVKLSEARRQQTLASHYAEGKRCMTEGRWDEAIAAFEKVVGIDSRYRDVEGQLEEANRQKKLAELYAAGEKHLASKEWEQAIECFRRIREIDESYRDASENMKKAAHERNLESLYDRGMRFFDVSKWSEALESWDKLMVSEPEYRNVADMVKEARRQQQLAELYRKGEEAFEKGQWLDAIESWEHLAGLQSDYRNVREKLVITEQKWEEHRSALSLQADELMAKGEPAEAIKILKQLKVEEARRKPKKD
jgi:tetratricopeptide (TPR) repeat protein